MDELKVFDVNAEIFDDRGWAVQGGAHRAALVIDRPGEG